MKLEGSGWDGHWEETPRAMNGNVWEKEIDYAQERRESGGRRPWYSNELKLDSI